MTDERYPLTEIATDPSSECPSCGRFVGPYETCPYCGAVIGQRMALRVFKYGSLVLAVVGLVVLLFVARRSQAPAVEIGDLVGTMNWAYVRIEGLVVRQPTYDPEAQSLKFWVWDGTGEIMTTAYRSEADALLAENRVPTMGDSVIVEGTLRIKEDFQYLILNVPQNVEIRPAEPATVSIVEASTMPLYQKVSVRGVVREDRIPYEGLRILTLRDASGEIDVTLPSGASPLDDAMPEFAVGQAIRVTGAIDQYKGTSQISVGQASDLAVLDETIAIAPARRLGELSTADVDALVQVEGVIVEVSPFSAGVKFTLDDGSGTVTLLLWQDLYDSLAERDALAEGAMIQVQGVVAEYQGELEILPEAPSDVTVLIFAEQPGRAQSIVEWNLGEITTDDVGQVVAVEGVLLSLRSFSAGVRGVLEDDTGAVTLLLWQDVYDGLAEPTALAPGAVLRVEGEVGEYKGELEIIPQASADVSVVGKVALPSQERAIGQFTTDDAGQTVQVAGQITQVTLFSKGMRYTLDDETGTITLLIWQDLYDQSELFANLAEGTWVAVRGEVAEYQGELEIVPQVPADVEITRGGPLAQTTPSPTPQLVIEPTAVLSPTPEATSTPTTQPTAIPAASPTSPPTPTPAAAIETRPIGAITAADVGSTLTIAQAGVADVTYFSAGVKYTLSDGSGSIILLAWQNVVEEIDDRYDLVPVSQVQVTGQIDEYQGDLEIIPQAGRDVTLLAPGEHLPIEERSVGDISASDEGRIFVVEGTVARTESNQWFKTWLNDGTGEIIVFVPERAVEYLPAGIGAGMRLRVTGIVDVYKDELEIIPLAGADVEVR